MSRAKFALILGIVGALLAVWLWSGDSEGDTPDDSVAAAGVADAGKTGPLAPKKPLSTKAAIEDTSGTITGRVLDPQGKPIAGADVCAKINGRDMPSMVRRRPHCTRSGLDGAYQLTKLMRSTYGVGAAARGFIPKTFGFDDEDFRGFELDRTPKVADIDIVLEPGGVEVAGMVKDLSGGEIEGAFVSVKGESNVSWGDKADWGAIAQTDAEGKFTAWVEEGDVRLRAYADGYTSGDENGLAPGQFFTLVLTPESVLAGIVKDEKGKPVEGAKVHASGGWFGDNNVAISDERGHYRIDGLSPGRYKPTANAEGAEGLARESVRLGVGETVDGVIVTVYAAAKVVAQVVDSAGEPCERGWISITDKARRDEFNETVKDGVATFKAVRPGNYKPSVTCEGFVKPKDLPEFEVETADVTDLVYTVEAGHTIPGIVVDSTGKAIPRASVFAQPANPGKESGMNKWARSDEDGRFEIEGVEPGEYKVSSWADDLPRLKDPVPVEVPENGEVAEVRIEFQAAGTIVGTVRDEHGAVVSGVSVRVKGPGWGGGTVLDDGSFTIEGLQPGEYRVMARGAAWGDSLRKPGATDDDVQGEPVTVVGGEEAEVDLVVEARDGKISGTVVDDGGGPVADAYIAYERESDSVTAAAGRAKQSSRWGWGREPVLTDVDGNFELENLTDGKYTVRAYLKGGGEAFVEHVEVGSNVQLEVELEGTISGSVTLAGGGTPDRFEVTVNDRKEGFRRNESFRRTGGEWSMAELPAGTYEVNVTASEGNADAKGIELVAGEEREGVDLELEGVTTIRGRVVSLEDGAPVEGISVMASSPGGGWSFSMSDMEGDQVTDADGRYVIANAPAGKVRLMTFSRNWTDDDAFGRGQVLFEAKAGGEVEAPDIKLPKTRVKRSEQAGSLGYKLHQTEVGAEPGNHPKIVGFIRPGGPASQTELKVGDVITSVDGHDVTGPNLRLYSGLTKVKEGVTVELGLAGGGSVSITAGPPE